MSQRTSLAAVITIVLAAWLSPGLAQAHGKVALEDDICVRRLGGNMVHFSAYQPQNAPKAEYCTDIPEGGDTFLVVDLVDPGLRTLPIGLRIVKAPGGADTSEEDQTVAYWKPTSHPDGVLRGEANLEKGLYKLIITAEGLSPSYYLLRVQQVDYSKIGQRAVGPIVIVLVLALIAYELSKTGRIRNWWNSRRTRQSP